MTLLAVAYTNLFYKHMPRTQIKDSVLRHIPTHFKSVFVNFSEFCTEGLSGTRTFTFQGRNQEIIRALASIMMIIICILM